MPLPNRKQVLGGLKAVATVLGVITALFSVWGIYQEVTGEVTAEVEYSDRYLLPPSMAQRLDTIHDLAHLLEARARYLPSDPYGTEFSIKAAELRQFLNDTRWYNYTFANGTIVWLMKVKNTRPDAAQNVRIEVPKALAAARVEGDAVVSLSDATGEGTVVQLGRIEPGREVRVAIWSLPISPHNLQLWHDDGKGTIVSLRPVGPFWAWMDKYWPFVTLVIVLPLLALGFISSGRQRRIHAPVPILPNTSEEPSNAPQAQADIPAGAGPRT